MTMPDAIIKRVEYLAYQEHRSIISGGWRFSNPNHEIFLDVTKGDDGEPLIDQEVAHPDIPANIPVL